MQGGISCRSRPPALWVAVGLLTGSSRLPAAFLAMGRLEVGLDKVMDVRCVAPGHNGYCAVVVPAVHDGVLPCLAIATFSVWIVSFVTLAPDPAMSVTKADTKPCWISGRFAVRGLHLDEDERGNCVPFVQDHVYRGRLQMLGIGLDHLFRAWADAGDIGVVIPGHGDQGGFAWLCGVRRSRARARGVARRRGGLRSGTAPAGGDAQDGRGGERYQRGGALRGGVFHGAPFDDGRTHGKSPGAAKCALRPLTRA